MVAGIVGTHKFAYDLWGDVVNTASRTESEGVAGSIQISPATYQLVKDEFACETRGTIAVNSRSQAPQWMQVPVQRPSRPRWPHIQERTAMDRWSE